MNRVSLFIPPVRTQQGGGEARPRFGGELNVSAPNTVGGSRYDNQRVSLSANDMVSDLIEKLDEIMTVTGEVYSGNEAFTGTLQVKFDNKNFPKKGGGVHSVDASLKAQVENTLKAVMVISSEASNHRDLKPLAEARATFTAVDPQSVVAGKFVTVPVTPLAQEPQHSQLMADAGNWNMGMFKFYKDLVTRLGARDPNVRLEDLSKVSYSPTRLVNSNIYVTPRMLNKKQTGHGGITSAIALKDIATLAESRVQKPAGINALQLAGFTANFIGPYVGTDALQFDTTIDNVEANGDVYLSTRINKYDTKQRKVTGPIILVHAKMEPVSSYSPKAELLTSAEVAAGDGAQRQQEAIAWSKLLG